MKEYWFSIQTSSYRCHEKHVVYRQMPKCVIGYSMREMMSSEKPLASSLASFQRVSYWHTWRAKCVRIAWRAHHCLGVHHGPNKWSVQHEAIKINTIFYNSLCILYHCFDFYHIRIMGNFENILFGLPKEYSILAEEVTQYPLPEVAVTLAIISFYVDSNPEQYYNCVSTNLPEESSDSSEGDGWRYMHLHNHQHLVLFLNTFECSWPAAIERESVQPQEFRGAYY